MMKISPKNWLLLGVFLGMLVAALLLLPMLPEQFDRWQATSKIEQLKQEHKALAKESKSSKQYGRIGQAEVVAYYPSNLESSTNQQIQELILADTQKLNPEGQDKDLNALIFYLVDKEEGAFANTQQVKLLKREYPISSTYVGTEKETTLASYYYTDEGKQLQLDELFQDPEAAQSKMLDMIKANLLAQNLNADRVAEVVETLQYTDLADWDFYYDKKSFWIHLPQAIGEVKQVAVPLTILFDVINPDMLKGADAESYQAYIAPSTKKVIALTFDDGPDSQLTPKLLDILEKEKVPATFFVLGRNVAGNEQILKRMSKRGSEIANHTFNHPNLQLLPTDGALAEIRDTQSEIKRATGIDSKLFRPPFGNYTSQTRLYGGLPTILWSVDTLDWQSHNPAMILEQVKTYARPGGIVLMHDIHKETIDAVPAVIDYLKKEGYEFVTVSDLLKTKGIDPQGIYYDRDGLIEE
ncbi:polysaccharide deacetylase family protein [Streptococcus danieliae]|uniref:Polysaccharide deacetylase family protein n=2 Tax=Streptococcus danieliae TaxID=747656 RepID=A0A7Z0RQS8_9STRE|nr:polysaccharide deacetylase family protein [Streptococcus danieliae]NYS49264.1 polysaccharide deacetylase family protein [Streptococcus danieliae]